MKRANYYIIITLLILTIPSLTFAAAWYDFPGKIIESFLGIFFEALLTFMAFALWLSGYLLNFVLKYTVVDMKTRLVGLDGINTAWRVVRDLMNIAFIFLLIYEAIKLIIGQSTTQQIGKFVGMIVLSALLINFSLFFTKVLIDGSNIVTVGFYNIIRGPNGATEGKGLSDPIVKALGLQKVYDQNEIQPDFNAKKGPGAMLVMGFGSAILILVAAFVFFAITVLFIVRYITLLILLMLSPVAYMGMSLPFMKSYSNQWWDALKSQLIFPPVFMLMIWLVLTLMSSKGFITASGTGSVSAVFDTSVRPDFGAMGLILNFTVIIGLLIGSLIVAKQTSTKGSKLIGDATGNISSFAGGALLGGAASLGRNTIGRAALRGTGVEELKARSDQGDLGARARLSLATGSMDVRRSFAGEKIADTTGFNLGKGLPFKPKAGEGGIAAAKTSNRKETEADQDNIITNYTKKRNWDGLSDYVTDKPVYLTQTEWEERQKYVYKKLNQRDKIDFERSLAAKTGGLALITTLRTKLPLDEQVKIYTDRKDWVDMAAWIMTKNPQDQSFIYEKMSARDRIELNGALTATGVTGSTLITRLNGGLSVEEQEKTIDADRKARKAIANEAAVKAVNLITTGAPNPVTGAPYTPAEIATLVAKMPDSAARDLDPAARIDPNINVHFRSKHLADLMSNGYPELTNAEAISIKTSIEAAHPSTHPVVQWLNNATRVADWS